jgi:hypothetical protein
MFSGDATPGTFGGTTGSGCGAGGGGGGGCPGITGEIGAVSVDGGFDLKRSENRMPPPSATGMKGKGMD